MAGKTTKAKVVKGVAPISPEQAKRQQDQEEIHRLNQDFAKMLAMEPKIPFKAPKYHAKLLGQVYPFALNSQTFVVRFDGSTQYFPKTVYEYLTDKLGKILDDSTPIEHIDEL